MLLFITFALIHNAILATTFFLLIGAHRKRGFQARWVTDSVGSIWVIFTGIILGRFLEISAGQLIPYLLVVLVSSWMVRFIFPSWIDIYAKFYVFLLAAEILYLLYKVAFLGISLQNVENVQGPFWAATGPMHPAAFVLGQLFFLLLMGSETFVLVCSAYAIFDGVSLMARRREAIDPIDSLEQPAAGTKQPKVSLHVPVCREPPDMVIETLSALAHIDYPDFEVIVISNNTQDPELWRPVAQTCRQLGFKFVHFDTLSGYKAGALNQALAETDEDAELIGIIDSDYIVNPGFLKRVAPLFQDASVAFVQTSQDYRNRESSPFLRMCYPVYKLFFDVVLVARSRRNSIMFAGTMGLIRKSALTQIGGWNEKCVAEDAEASLRILNMGYRGTYLHESWGYGLLPPDFSGCEKQWARWMVGGIQVVRINRRALFSLHSGLAFAQRWDYTVGGLMSFGAFLTITSIFLLAGIALTIAIDPAWIPAIFASLSTSLLIFSFFVTLTAMTVILIFSWSMNYSSKRSIGAFLFVMGLSWCRANAVWQALTRKAIAFERTTKFRVTASYFDAFWRTRYQIVMAILVVGLNLTIFLKYESRPPGVIILSIWQEITYLSSIAMAVLSVRHQ